VIALATLASAVIAWLLIFPMPALFLLALLACLAVACVVARPGREPAARC
jgi:hypothetical protein